MTSSDAKYVGQHVVVNTSPRTFSTDPDWYSDAIPEDMPTETLEQVYVNARQTYYRAGGHNLAHRMQRVMDLAVLAMHDRGFLLGDTSSENFPNVTWVPSTPSA